MLNISVEQPVDAQLSVSEFGRKVCKLQPCFRFNEDHCQLVNSLYLWNCSWFTICSSRKYKHKAFRFLNISVTVRIGHRKVNQRYFLHTTFLTKNKEDYLKTVNINLCFVRIILLWVLFQSIQLILVVRMDTI